MDLYLKRIKKSSLNCVAMLKKGIPKFICYVYVFIELGRTLYWDMNQGET